MTRRSRLAACCGALIAALAVGGCGTGSETASAAVAPAGTVDLAASERLGGHTLARHVGRTDDDLIERLRREPGLAAASTYTDQATAERVVAATLQRFSRRIESWAARTGTRPNLALDYSGDPAKPVGRSLRRGERRARECADAVVVLRWHPGGSFFVLTSYPECQS